MTNDEWCRIVLKKFWPESITDQTDVSSPGLHKLTGEIWQDWHNPHDFARSIPMAPDYMPPTPNSLYRLVASALWKYFTDDPYGVPVTIRARIQHNYGGRVSVLLGTGLSMDDMTHWPS
jgi:hypothetical protein